MKNTNWGIIGPGKIAHKFAQDLALVPGARLHAVASRTLEKAQQFAAQYNAPHAFGSYEELVQLPDLDAVYVATPHSEHHAHTLLCLRAGVAVLCEKAFARNAAEVAEMVAVAREKQVFLMEALWTRFMPATHKALELVGAGAIGRPVHIVADFGFAAEYNPASRLFDPGLAGGSLLDIGIYPVFFSKFFLGEPTQVKAVGALTETGVDLTCSMALAYPSGATASLYSTLAATTDTTCTIYGTEGKLHLHHKFHHAQRITLHRTGEEPQDFHFEEAGYGYRHEAQHVQECLAQGLTESPLVPLAFSEKLIATLDDIRQQLGVHYPGE
ncbi:Gfo/Idh/MocA family oxidoreductase [Hymenobacter aerilatus]|uniref:Gfo/Idh/MocA family oxidoreductase n=1 Tax=Hymenobacter aerilatus TaxID=2932251 RepID=A0A8T9SS04_9BACT|nr:Gfo/Idh/MocA family oxidoreductase [Hymenobacter aerilatus]UOR04527.1 Gfo/Idh/MocA family oxidoreductase [Hymenobacter aerilatus]